MGGTNEIKDNNFNSKHLLSNVRYLLQNNHRKKIIYSIPFRCDKPILNTIINKKNSNIKHLVLKYNHGVFIPIDDLDRHLYTRHGLHFDRRGKHYIANNL